MGGSNRPRPSRALIDAARDERRRLEGILLAVKNARVPERDAILDSIAISSSGISLPEGLLAPTVQHAGNDDTETPQPQPPMMSNDTVEGTDCSSDDEAYDVSTFLSVDERGRIRTYGPSSSLHTGSPSQDFPEGHRKCSTTEADAYQLIASAALARQKEHQLRSLPVIGGIAGELALHLLDLHWNRAHHTFLLTYRPAVMRDLLHGGPYCSEFLLTALFAVTAKYSERLELRTNPNDPTTAGKTFLDRCDELIARDHLLCKSSIPTISGLVMLGGTFNALGQFSKGWLYTGYALRMVYDLGLHLDSHELAASAEDLEIRRRVFWGAFVCDKLQSLYFGRPVTIQLEDVHVSTKFLDTYEEMELWQPYADPLADPGQAQRITAPSPLYSVTTFQRLCSLSKIMTKIMNKIYRVGATAATARPHLASIDRSLDQWYRNLPPHLVFEPWTQTASEARPQTAAPNVLTLLTTYFACVVLLHRPFVSCGHLKTTDIPSNSWKRCNTAARNITSLSLAYQAAYGLRRASYLLAYAVYVACTIHARNPHASASRGEERSSPLLLSLQCLDEIVLQNPGVSSQARVVRKLLETNGIPEPQYLSPQPAASHDHAPSMNLDMGNFDFSNSLFTPSAFADVPDFSSFPTFDTDNQGVDPLFGFMDINGMPGF